MDAEPNTYTIPSLAQAKRWVAWRLETPKGRGKPTKVPYDPKNGRPAKSDDPTTWATRTEAEAWAEKMPKPFGVGGVGLMLGPSTLDSLCFGGIDLDACRDTATGQIAPWAVEALSDFETYAEVSPSETGVKVFFSYDPKDMVAIRVAMGSETGKKWARKSKEAHPPAIELYICGRYFAVTDQQFGTQAEIKPVSLETVKLLISTAPDLIADPEAEMEEKSPRKGREARAASVKAPKQGGTDQSRSGIAFGLACGIIRGDGDFAEFADAVKISPELAGWPEDKTNPERELKRTWGNAQQAVEKAGWKDQLHLDRYGSPRPSHLNAMLYFRNDPKLGNLIGFDEMAMVASITRPFPKGTVDGRKYPRPLEDTDVLNLLEYLQRQGLSTITRDAVHNAVMARANEWHFHPVRDYLNRLTWDGRPRIYDWLHIYMGVDRSAYAAEIGAMFLISMVARVFEPGCKADHMLVLEGKQNQGKSQACRALASPWFSDNLPPLSHDEVRSSMALRGYWLIEIAEMHAMGRAEAAQLKAFVSRQEERYVPKHARLPVVEPRQTVFIGTTNKAEYLQDETGARRFWPVPVANVDVASLVRDRDQLLAEAVRAYKNGVPWWPDASLLPKDVGAEIEDEQEGRFEADAWEGMIAEYLDKTLTKRTTIGDLAMDALLMNRDELSPDKQRRIAKILKRLGWEAKRNMKARWWELAKTP